eukprot:CAMPEP_0202711212 /NCGR_PEP_ID=MMETSP1385-20130828/23056_1 /ASSEMBLY_ACC=CAM_ASM_000861 /TAXON_ID=933848 /ORGANISM="Elphidium margaritaceum" /LENGTH=617 /DNA_ID=CAMNT_0049370899 /DNA_START=82 /DNA_END=1935 /DNA_ORIENTATION=-
MIVSHFYKETLIATVIGIATFIAYQTFQRRSIRRALHGRGKQKREELNQPQPLFVSLQRTVDPHVQQKILSLTATQVRQQIIDGRLKCIEVMIAYCLKCDQVNKKVNALFEKHYDAGIKDALELDAVLASKRKESKEAFLSFVSDRFLLGIPISVKDVFEMKNSDSTNGILACCNSKFESDGAVVQVIRRSGGIPFCKTSVPQLLMMCENWNNIIGDTLNPYDLTRSCGGSSGGEGAIVGGGGSCIGVGGDIGGSLRIPAHFNGIIAYKPSTKRTLLNGKVWCFNDDGKARYTSKFGILPSVGPMARCMDDIVLFMRAFWTPKAFELDMYSAPIPFRDEMYLRSFKPTLTVGYFINDGWFTAAQCVQRAINECVNGLRTRYKYNIVPIEFDKGPEILRIYLRYMFASDSNMSSYIHALRGESLHPQFQMAKFYMDIPDVLKRWLVHPLLRCFGERRKAFFLEQAAMNGGLTSKQLQQMLYEIMKFRYEFWSFIERQCDEKIDVILSPVCCYPALPLGFSKDFATSLTSTWLQNILDCCAGSIGPVTFVKSDECHYDEKYIPMKERDLAAKKLNEYMLNAKGLPVNVQVFGRPFDDEIVLRVMKELEDWVNSTSDGQE